MLVNALVKPGSKHREEVTIGQDGNLVIYTKAGAIEGKANQAAIRLLAKHYRVSQSQVTLLRGHSAKTKTFKISR